MVEKIASARNQMAASTTTKGFMIRFTRILRGIKARTIHKFHPLTPLIQARGWNHFRGNFFLNLNGAYPEGPDCRRSAPGFALKPGHLSVTDRRM
jgi:hypothetical protein